MRKARRAGLARAEKFAFAAQLQILLGNPEAVFRFPHDGKPRMAGFAERPLVEQDAGRGLVAAPDTAAQLVQLRQPEALGMFDHHDRRIRHVDADFDDGGGHQQPRSRRS